MAREFFKDLPNTTTPLTADRLNGLLNGDEALGSIVVDDVSGKNLFDGILESGNINDSGQETSSTNTIRSVNKYEVIGGQTYICSYTTSENTYLNVVACYDASGTFIQRLTGMRKTAFTVPSNCKYIRTAFYNNNGLTVATFNSTVSNVQLEKGSTATEYTEYKQPVKKTSAGVKEDAIFYANNFKSKNLIDVSNITSATGISRSGDVITLNGSVTNTSWTLSEPIILKANTTYTLSLTNVISDTTEGRFILRNGETNVVAVYFNNASKQVQYTPTSDTTIDTLRIFGGGTTYSNYSFSVQLEIGSEATSYIEYKNFDNEYKYDIIQNQDVSFTETAQSFPFNITKYDRIRVAVNNSYNRTFFVYFEKNDILGNTSIYQKILDFTDNANFSSLVAGRITLNTTNQQISIVYDKKNSTFPLTLKSIVGYYR